MPADGKPFNTALPVDIAQVGCVMVPSVGEVGVAGWVLMTMLAVAEEIQPEELVTV